MLPSRRFSFQLIPLLDLLLIVVFAQYLEGRIEGERQAEEAAARKDILSRELDATLQQLLALREKLAAMEDQVKLAEAQQLEVDRLRLQRDYIGELLGEVFRVPAGTLEPLLKRITAAGPGPSKEDIAQVKARLHALGSGSGEQVIQHLLTFGELRKRVDVWELYLQDNGGCVLQVGGRRMAFRAETSEGFATRLFEAYKTLPESKSMVLILVSYGDAKFKPLKATLD